MRIDGTFAKMNVRSEYKQEKPYPTIVDALAAPTKPAPAKASSSPKTGNLSPLAIGGLALAALLGAGALALSLARRRA